MAFCAEQLGDIEAFARTIRKEIIQMVYEAGTGHPGGSLSAADLLSVLYKKHLRFEPSNPGWPERDRFILSKGHAAPLLYAVLGHVGYFPLETLRTFRRFGSILQGHPDSKRTPGVEISTGSLGQGLSIGGGMALGAKKKNAAWRTYVLMGDGEVQEGQVWEAAMSIPHFRLDNLTAILDANSLQIDGPVQKIMNISPISKRFEAFGWHVQEIDGHDLTAIDAALSTATETKGQPSIIVARTIKGKGVSFMENAVQYHHAKDLSEEQRDQAFCDIDGQRRLQ